MPHVMNTGDSKLGIQGYCPVAYFFGPPKKGSKDFASDYEGVTYLFANADVKALFDKDPA